MIAFLIVGIVNLVLSGSSAVGQQKQDKNKPETKSYELKKKQSASQSLEAIKAQIGAALKSGKITEAQAKEKLQSLSGKKPENTKAKGNSTSQMEAAKAQINAALKAGKITESEAKAKYKALYSKGVKSPNEKAKGPTEQAHAEFIEKLAELVEAGKLTKAEATELYNSVIKKPAFTPKKGVKGADYKINDPEEQKRLQKILPLTSTGDDNEGPVACGFFGWAADATHRFMDNSHQGDARQIHGLSFRLDYRDHDTIGRTWDNITVKIAHGKWSSIKYNASQDYELLDQETIVFSKEWTFPTLKGYPALKPAEWGGPQNCLNFQFDKPFMYNGKDAIYVEFTFSGGKTEDGRNWGGDLPYGFEYFLDSMQQIGGWRMAGEAKGLYLPPRVEAVVSYTAGGQSVWTSSAKGMPFLNWDFRKTK
ncbi:MAG: hypothetical protein CMJ82_05685 [Planctomycetaceae bacterium]|nr:hypothetical protein [Planctomycetaceae bacterium]